MRVRISTNPPLPLVKAWFPLTHSIQNIATFKSTLCTSISALHDFLPRSLHLTIDGFELLDSSELDVLRDGDLICIDVLDATTCNNVAQPTQRPDASRKRKRPVSSSSSSSSESESDSNTESDTTTSTESESTSDASATHVVRQTQPPKAHVKTKLPAQSPETFVPPGYGKPQTRLRNLRRRRKQMHERDAACVSKDGPVSGANAVVQSQASRDANGHGHTMPELMSLSLRNKNKARNFKALINKPLPPKIVFDEEGKDATSSVTTTRVTPRLIPPSSRVSLPPNMFVTSVDVEVDLYRERRKGKMQVEYGDMLDEGGEDALESEVDVDRLESTAEKQWDTLGKLTREKPIRPGMIVGHKGLGINPESYTPEEMLTVGVVMWSGEDGVGVRPLRAVSFGGPVDGEATEHTWDEIEHEEWKIILPT